MHQRIRLAWLLALLVAVLLLPARPAAAKLMYHYDFEKTSKPWHSGATADTKVAPLAVRKDENGCPSVFDVSHAFVQFKTKLVPARSSVEAIETIPGKFLGAWIMASLPGSGSDLVRLSWSEKGAGGKTCPECKAILYLGSVMPSDLTQFRSARPSVTDPPAWGEWTTYQYPATGGPEIPISNKGTIYAAIGMTAPSSKEGRTEGFGVDCIDLTIFPAP